VALNIADQGVRSYAPLGEPALAYRGPTYTLPVPAASPAISGSAGLAGRA